MLPVITAADGFALCMIAILGLSFLFLFAIFFVMLRNPRHRVPEVDDLIDEVSREPERRQPASGPVPSEPKPEAWERKQDWWKS